MVSLGHATCQGYGKHKGEFAERYSRFVIFIYLNTVCILCLYLYISLQIYNANIPVYKHICTTNECMLYFVYVVYDFICDI